MYSTKIPSCFSPYHWMFFYFLLFVQAASDLNNDEVLRELEEFCRNDDALHLQERLGSFSNGIWKPNTDLQAQYPRSGYYMYYQYLVSLLCVATLLFWITRAHLHKLAYTSSSCVELSVSQANENVPSGGTKRVERCNSVSLVSLFDCFLVQQYCREIFVCEYFRYYWEITVQWSVIIVFWWPNQ